MRLSVSKAISHSDCECSRLLPPDRRGNRDLIGICALNLLLFPLIKLYYIQRNQRKRKQWEALSSEVSL